ncbi:Synaptojanin-1 [Cichlidogyrus casuarinus]|uniref:phosphoinositide 5-phosphatase n=1 Tax=Cichlidogyrus casuarinus TaxID=1844966 RepID=A0ABD2QJK5_9PLAT
MGLLQNIRIRHTAIHKNDRENYAVILETKAGDKYLKFQNNNVYEISPDDFQKMEHLLEKRCDAYGCLGVYQRCSITDSESHLLTPHLYLVIITQFQLVAKLPKFEIYRVADISYVPLFGGPEALVIDDEMMEIRKLLSSGSFYFATYLSSNYKVYDLTLSTQKHALLDKNPPPSNNTRIPVFHSDLKFLWNRSLMFPLLRMNIDPGNWLVFLICGGVDFKVCYHGAHQPKMCIVSRVSNRRPGTRFLARGVNDDGDVGNYVETEQIICYSDSISSFVQVRGTVPIHWSQPGIQVGSHKIRFSRCLEGSIFAYNRHFEKLLAEHKDTFILNLMAERADEKQLSIEYKKLHELSNYKDSVQYHAFDYHANVKHNPESIPDLFKKIAHKINSWDVFLMKNDEIILLQHGSPRINCVDCLDRTNAIQKRIGMDLLLMKQLSLVNLHFEKPLAQERFFEQMEQMWTNNGDYVSRIYAGSGALSGRSKFKDAQRSAARALQNNLWDVSKQQAMSNLAQTCPFFLWSHRMAADHFLPRALHQLHVPILWDALDQFPSYCDTRELKIFIGTWNVNGGKRYSSVLFKDDRISDWIFDLKNNLSDTIGFVNPSIGIQDIPDYPINKRATAKGSEHVVLVNIQLVGVCLFVFVRRRLLEVIRSVESASVKTGLRGTAGNKGAVAVSLQIGATSYCFVASHFAAGQSNVAERNEDYRSILNKLTFSGGKHVRSHDYAFWFGDFNYRIDMPGDTIKELVLKENWPQLLEADQLRRCTKEKLIFEGFHEAQIRFAPTYKYDLMSLDYDTSEKARSPAWTDRILSRRHWYVFPRLEQSGQFLDSNHRESPLKNWAPPIPLIYHRAELKLSDHRPVGAIFTTQNFIPDSERRGSFLKKLLNEYGPTDGIIWVRILLCNTDDLPLEQGIHLPQNYNPYQDKVAINSICVKVRQYGFVNTIRFDESVGGLFIHFNDPRSVLFLEVSKSMNRDHACTQYNVLAAR